MPTPTRVSPAWDVRSPAVAEYRTWPEDSTSAPGSARSPNVAARTLSVPAGISGKAQDALVSDSCSQFAGHDTRAKPAISLTSRVSRPAGTVPSATSRPTVTSRLRSRALPSASAPGSTVSYGALIHNSLSMAWAGPAPAPATASAPQATAAPSRRRRCVMPSPRHWSAEPSPRPGGRVVTARLVAAVFSRSPSDA
ncbi:hypothetical protein ACIBO6_11450 [Streptomyces luteogriseus]|uniref:hypothetical protein n=1 Tax=Streptomyces luteogriseus TaxID=68233 RepID=UPI00379AD61E